jgi:hypothetical protein
VEPFSRPCVYENQARSVDFGRRAIVIREGKGLRDRVTMLPFAVVDDLSRQLHRRSVCTSSGNTFFRPIECPLIRVAAPSADITSIHKPYDGP